MIDLKPCPFCNDAAELDFARRSFAVYTDKNGVAKDLGLFYTVRCSNEICGCQIGVYETPEMAIKAWNDRVPVIDEYEGYG